MTYILRKAEKKESTLIFEGYRATVGPYVERAWGWDDGLQVAGFWKYHSISEFQVIEVEKKFAGGVHVKEEENKTYIKMIFLLPRYQNKGMGTSLIKDLQKVCCTKSKSLNLKVIKGNPAIHCYQRLGFVIVDEDESFIMMQWA